MRTKVCAKVDDDFKYLVEELAMMAISQFVETYEVNPFSHVDVDRVVRFTPEGTNDFNDLVSRFSKILERSSVYGNGK